MSTLSEIIKQIPDLHRSAGTIGRVVEITGLKYSIVRKHLLLAGVRLRRGSPTGSRSPERDQRVIAIYHSGKTLEQTAAVFGVTPERIRQILVRDEISRGVAPQRHGKLPAEPQLRRCARKECDRLFSAHPPSSPVKYCSRQCTNAARIQRLEIPLPIDALRADRGAGLTLKQIAAKYGVTTMTIYRRLTKGARRSPGPSTC